MKMLFLAATALAAAALAIPASAQEGAYAGLGYTQFDPDNVSGADVGGVTGRLGYRFHPNFAVEGEATLGTADDNNAELDNAYGVYAVGIVPVTSNLDLFGRVGYQHLSVDGQGPTPVSFDDGGLGYGAGAELRVSPRFGIRGEYTRLDEADTDSWSIGGVARF